MPDDIKSLIIYNSRNYLGYLNLSDCKSRLRIYNSRNYLGYLNERHFPPVLKIYNSRNYLGYLNLAIDGISYLSTIVEII